MVADEVRTLAQSTQQSTDEIKAMVEKLVSSANAAVQAMGEGQIQAEKVVSVSGNVAEVFARISTGIGNINASSEAVTEQINQQFAITQNVENEIEALKNRAQNNGRLAGLIEESGKSVATTLSHLEQQVSQFRID